ncbi:signal recognition particle 9 kDa protein-like isoform X1 [Coturnix japonica]|uniref:signal recognition particle 9 kDa protein-like isoform X1 n=1 Tax=Coturnix japonica TaxID=93934 RepID=UPI000777F148|nr:signal recognition particle 9 kDa protein-like isoform X1 [Coturnix japonica]
MPHYQAWEEFTRAAEKLYLADPMKVRVVLKYRHCDGNLCIKVTDDVAVSLYFRILQKQRYPSTAKIHRHGTALVLSAEVFQEHLQTDIYCSAWSLRFAQSGDRFNPQGKLLLCDEETLECYHSEM